MNDIARDFIDLTLGQLVIFAGVVAIAISLFRLRSRDFSLLYFGLFCVIYGIRWLAETPTMRSLVGYPFTAPYFSGLLTYIVVIPWSAFLVSIFGRGYYDSLLWSFRSTIVYAVVAIAIDFLRSGPLVETRINPFIVVVWCIVAVANLIFLKGPQQTEIRVARYVIFFLFFSVANDNLAMLGFIPWKVRLEHIGLGVMWAGLGYVAARHFLSTEKKLLAIAQEMHIARRIQQSNLPARLPPSGRVDIGARYVPMSAVAGDFYDVLAKGDSGVGVLIADVSGHGVGAALIGSMLKVGFASQEPYLDDPARVLEKINQVLQGKIEDSFVTACSLFVDFEKGILRYAIAGHPPPYLLRKSKREIMTLSHAGPLLGPFPASSYENKVVSLVKGDRVVLYTDGLIETRSRSGELFGTDRLEARLIAQSDETADLCAGHIIDHLMEWSGRSGEDSIDDDLTLVVLDVLLTNSR